MNKEMNFVPNAQKQMSSPPGPCMTSLASFNLVENIGMPRKYMERNTFYRLIYSLLDVIKTDSWIFYWSQ